MLIDYFNNCARACNLSIAAQSKIMETFIDIYRCMVWYLSWTAFRKEKDYVMEEERV
jgi:hypothetical protein